MCDVLSPEALRRGQFHVSLAHTPHVIIGLIFEVSDIGSVSVCVGQGSLVVEVQVRGIFRVILIVSVLIKCLVPSSF